MGIISDSTTEELMEAMIIRPKQSFFLTKTFFKSEKTHVTEKVKIDIKKGKKRMAPFVSGRIGGSVIGRDGFRTDEFHTPRIAPERELSIDILSERMPGESLYSTKTPEDREAEMLVNDHDELNESIEIRKEWMAHKVIFDGKINVKDVEKGVDINIDFGSDNITVLSGNNSWLSESSDPIKALKKERKKIIRETGTAPNAVIMGNDVIDIFMNHTKVKNQLESRRINNVIIEPKIVDDAVTYYGRINEIGMDIYTCEETILDDGGNEIEAVPLKSVLIGNITTGIGQIEYGLVSQYEGDVLRSYEAKVVPKIYVPDNAEVKLLRLTSRPLLRPYNTELWSVLYPLGA